MLRLIPLAGHYPPYMAFFPRKFIVTKVSSIDKLHSKDPRAELLSDSVATLQLHQKGRLALIKSNENKQELVNKFVKIAT